jgi:hypothetical protein
MLLFSFMTVASYSPAQLAFILLFSSYLNLNLQYPIFIGLLPLPKLSFLQIFILLSLMQLLQHMNFFSLAILIYTSITSIIFILNTFFLYLILVTSTNLSHFQLVILSSLSLTLSLVNTDFCISMSVSRSFPNLSSLVLSILFLEI